MSKPSVSVMYPNIAKQHFDALVEILDTMLYSTLDDIDERTKERLDRFLAFNEWDESNWDSYNSAEDYREEFSRYHHICRSSDDDVNEIGAFLDETDYSAEAVDVYLSNFGKFDRRDFALRYRGQHNDLGKFAQELCEGVYDLRDVPAFILLNVDWDGVWSELEQDYYEDNGHIFDAH